VSTEIFLSPCPKFVDPKALGQLPVLFAEETHCVFGEEASIPYAAESIQIVICNTLILLAFFLPGAGQMAPRLEFTLETAGTSRIVAADRKLTGTFHQTVGDPALVGGVVIGHGAGRQIERVTVRDAVPGVNLASASAGDKRQEQNEGNKSHNCSIRHSH